MPDTLMKRPELARNVACYIGLWNMAETLVPACLEKLFGDRHGDAILGPIQSINVRLDIVEAVLKLHAELDWVSAILAKLPRLRACNSYRIRLVHGLYVEKEDESGALLAGNVFDSRRPFRQEEITSEAVMAEYRTLERLILEMLVVLQQ